MNAATSRELKKLETERARLNEEQSKLAHRKGSIERQQTFVRHQLHNVEERIAILCGEANPPVVTEHAILRYLERVQGVDVNAVIEAILTPEAVRAIDRCGTCEVNSAGFTLVVKARRVITIKTKESK